MSSHQGIHNTPRRPADTKMHTKSHAWLQWSIFRLWHTYILPVFTLMGGCLSHLIRTGSVSLPCGREVFKVNVLLTPSAAIEHPRADDVFHFTHSSCLFISARQQWFFFFLICLKILNWALLGFICQLARGTSAANVIYVIIKIQYKLLYLI